MKLLGFPSAALIANMLSLTIVGQINQQLPESQRESYFWYDLRIRKRHHQLYPESKLVLFLDICIITVVLSFAAFVILLQ